jgi:hypothetical protein
MKKVKRFILKYTICRIRGHKLGLDWGYAGGEYADRWCDRCDACVSVPKDSIRFVFKESSWLMKEIKDDIHI